MNTQGVRISDRLGQSMRYLRYPPSANYPVFTAENCMLSRHLNPEIYEKLYTRITANGVTLDKCIQVGVEKVAGTILGLIAGDEDCYWVYADIFDPVIDEKHLGFGKMERHPPPDIDPARLQNGVLDPKYAKSVRIRTGRNIRGICFSPCMCRAERRTVERAVVTSLQGMTGEHKGQYYPLSKISPSECDQLIKEHLLFRRPEDHMMKNSTIDRDWPDARGIWINPTRNFLVWVNEKDHCRIISMQEGGDMKTTFERFARAVWQLCGLMKKNGYQFMWNERLGYLSACPSNIGTGLRCSVMLQLRNLSKDTRFDAILRALKMEKRGSAGENTEAVDDTYDISNYSRIKNTETELVQQVVTAAHQLIVMEKRLETGQSIDDLLPPDVK